METKRMTDIKGLLYLWKVDNLYLAGQPELEAWDQIKELGVKKVFNLRAPKEMDFAPQEKKLQDLNLDYEQLTIVSDGKLDAAICEKLSQQINDKDTFFIHCKSANRVAAWLIVYLVKSRGLSFDAAVEVAQENGLSNPDFIIQAQEIL